MGTTELSSPGSSPRGGQLDDGLGRITSVNSRTSFVHRFRGTPSSDQNRYIHGQLIALFLDQVIGHSKNGPLFKNFSEKEPHLKKSLQSLTGSQRKILKDKLGAGNLRQLASLSRESDGILFFKGLFLVGRSMVQQGRREEGIGLLQTAIVALGEIPDTSRGDLKRIREEMTQEIAAMEGRGGPLGLRLEYKLSHFIEEVTDPVMLAGFGIAAGTFGLVRHGILSRVMPMVGENSLPALLGGRLLAFTGGVAAESIAFSSATRGLKYLLGHQLDNSSEAIRDEILSMMITMGFLRGSGIVSRGIFNRVHGINPLNPAAGPVRLGRFARLSQVLIPQSSMLGGIILAHKAESQFGLRPDLNGADLALDSLVTLMHFNVAGNLFERVQPKWFHRWTNGLEARSNRLIQESYHRLRENLGRKISWNPGEEGLALATASGERGSPNPSQKGFGFGLRFPSVKDFISMMSGKEGSEPSAPAESSRAPSAGVKAPKENGDSALDRHPAATLLTNEAGEVVYLKKPGGELLEELQGHGTEVSSIKAYEGGLPKNTSPLWRAVQDIIAGRVDMLLLTRPEQIDHLLEVTTDKWEELKLRRALTRVAVFSANPATTTRLIMRQVFPDLKIENNNMAQLIEEVSQKGPEAIRQKQDRAKVTWVRLEPGETFSQQQKEDLWNNSPMMRATRRLPNDRIPVWLMRQAGRYMEEYMLVRRGNSFLDFCKNPELCTEATITAVERTGVDAAIIFADILTILEPLGLPLEFKKGVGPVIDPPIRDTRDIYNLREVHPEEGLGFTLEAIRQVRREMHPRVPLIGFAGAPFTLASYAIEGRSSKNYIHTKMLMHEEPTAWHTLMFKLTNADIAYLKAQVEAGAQVLQVFDSWVGALSPTDYKTFVLPHMKRLFSELPKDVPTIHFGTGTATLLSLQREAGGDVIGLDWRTDPVKAWSELGDVGIQGNLDPTLLFSKPEVFLPEVQRILDSVGSRPGFIFNLGHGIMQGTPVDHVTALVDYVHNFNPKR